MTDPDRTLDDPRLSQLSVRALVGAICRRIGLEPADVGAMTITPTKLTATVYKRNRDGHKYLNGDGVAATETWEVQIRG